MKDTGEEPFEIGRISSYTPARNLRETDLLGFMLWTLCELQESNNVQKDWRPLVLRRLASNAIRRKAKQEELNGLVDRSCCYYIHRSFEESRFYKRLPMLDMLRFEYFPKRTFSEVYQVREEVMEVGKRRHVKYQIIPHW